MSFVVHADHVLRGDAPPLADGAVVVDARGVVVDVGPAAELLPRHRGLATTRIRGVVFPGLVNAHTHVELSNLRGKIAGGRGFVQWVDTLVATRTESTPEDEAEAVELAAADLARFATVAVGEVTNSLAAVAALARTGLAGCVFHEVLGLDRAVVMRRIEGLRAELEERLPSWPTSDLTYAPSPHTLYTLHEDAAKTLLDAARARGLRVSVHLAEHPSERRAVEQGDGPIPDWFVARFKASPAFARVPLFDLAARVGALREGVVLVHLTEARPEELARVAASGASVVFCPRSNLYIEGKLPPLLAARAAGLEVALGTDSLASNASLDVLAEAKALADRFPSVPATDLVAMATWNGARALGRPDLGRIARHANPGLYAVDGDVPSDPATWLLSNLTKPRRCLAPRTGARATHPVTPLAAEAST
ncbi:MAG: amidohydrolase family protein [Labilithrix sp.]|nr:amidohydrolase family protein [Labilithrix sp.]MCW5816005.1 amidohydrolase family protein [Labilithrix sp.]